MPSGILDTPEVEVKVEPEIEEVEVQ